MCLSAVRRDSYAASPLNQGHNSPVALLASEACLSNGGMSAHCAFSLIETVPADNYEGRIASDHPMPALRIGVVADVFLATVRALVLLPAFLLAKRHWPRRR